MKNKDKFAELFKKSVKNNTEFNEALAIVKQNTEGGNIWVIGGLVYRNIVNQLYRPKRGSKIFDFDFLIEKPKKTEDIKIPKGWKLSKTSVGSPRFVKGKKQIDFVPIDNVSIIKKNNLKPNIKNYFKGTPLKIQQIVYDTNKEEIQGKIGIKAILSKKIEVNNFEELVLFCKRRKISWRKFMQDKAKSLGFRFVFPNLVIDNIKRQTKRFYDKYSQDYGLNMKEDYQSFIQSHLLKEVNLFLEKLKGKKILDLGCGLGRDSIFFRGKGLRPVCIDISPAMVKLCKERELEAYEMDMENIDLNENSFDGVWAYASLLHIPKKRIDNVLARVKELLKSEGLFFLGMVEGNYEILCKSSKNPGEKRFFALYKDEELRKLLSRHFKIFKISKFVAGKNQTYLNYLCKKKIISK